MRKPSRGGQASRRVPRRSSMLRPPIAIGRILRGMVERAIVTAKPPRQSRQHYWYVMPRRSRAVDDLRSDRRTPAGEPEGRHPAKGVHARNGGDARQHKGGALTVRLPVFVARPRRRDSGSGQTSITHQPCRSVLSAQSIGKNALPRCRRSAPMAASPRTTSSRSQRRREAVGNEGKRSMRVLNPSCVI
jgi:hypothetical protein